jgi:hypothetical protein
VPVTIEPVPPRFGTSPENKPLYPFLEREESFPGEAGIEIEPIQDHALTVLSAPAVLGRPPALVKWIKQKARSCGMVIA